MNGNTFSVLAVLGSSKTLGRLMIFIHFLVTSTHRIPHSWILWSWQHGFAIVIQGIIAHALKFIGLSKPIPSSEIFRIYLHCISIRLNCPRNVFHLQILMPHQCPCSQTGPVQFQSFSKVHNSLQVLSHQRVVIADNTTSFRIVLVIVKLSQCQICQLPLVFLYVQNVWVSVHVLKSVWVEGQ